MAKTITAPLIRAALGSRHQSLPEAIGADLFDIIPIVGDYANHSRYLSASTEGERAARGKRASMQLVDYAVGDDQFLPGIGTVLDILTPTNTILYLDDQGKLPKALKDATDKVGTEIARVVETVHSALDLTKLPIPIVSEGVKRVVNGVAVQPFACIERGEGPIACAPQMWDQVRLGPQNQRFPFLKGPRDARRYFDDTRQAWGAGITPMGLPLPGLPA